MKSKFSEGHRLLSEKKNRIEKNEGKQTWDFGKIKKDGLWVNKRRIIIDEENGIYQ